MPREDLVRTYSGSIPQRPLKEAHREVKPSGRMITEDSKFQDPLPSPKLDFYPMRV